MKTLFAVLLLSSLAVAQGPSLRQCRSEAVLWRIGLFNTQGEADLESSPHLSADDLMKRSDEMAECAARFKKNSFLEISRGYYMIYQWRVYKFVGRHNLLPQFAEEDQAGQR